jgi:hypothetical protein
MRLDQRHVRISTPIEEISTNFRPYFEEYPNLPGCFYIVEEMKKEIAIIINMKIADVFFNILNI